jgi:hypothetical protein
VSAERATGTVAEEAARLLEAVQQAAARWHRGSAQAGGAATGHTEVPITCRVCPLCQLLSAVQQVRPETLQHLADAAAAFTAALGDIVPSAGGTSTRGSSAGGTRSEQPASTAESDRERRRDDVQHIDITD